MLTSGCGLIELRKKSKRKWVPIFLTKFPNYRQKSVVLVCNQQWYFCQKNWKKWVKNFGLSKSVEEKVYFGVKQVFFFFLEKQATKTFSSVHHSRQTLHISQRCYCTNFNNFIQDGYGGRRLNILFARAQLQCYHLIFITST